VARLWALWHDWFFPHFESSMSYTFVPILEFPGFIIILNSIFMKVSVLEGRRRSRHLIQNLKIYGRWSLSISTITINPCLRGKDLLEAMYKLYHNSGNHMYSIGCQSKKISYKRINTSFYHAIYENNNKMQVYMIHHLSWLNVRTN
jgi:hypothetical protein